MFLDNGAMKMEEEIKNDSLLIHSFLTKVHVPDHPLKSLVLLVS